MDEKSLTSFASINAAVNEENSLFSLEDIHQAIIATNTASQLDPLDILPLLFPCPINVAFNLIQIVSENCSAKEVILAVQEAMERLLSSIDADEDDEDESKPVTNVLPLAAQLDRMVSSYVCAIPHLAPSSSHLFETIRNLSRDLDHAIKMTAPSASPSHSRSLIITVSVFVRTVIMWVRARVDDLAKISECSDILFSLLDTTLSSNARSLETSIAYRVFESFFPKLVVRTAVKPDWENREAVVSKALDAAKTLGYTLENLRKRYTIGSLILLSHSNLDQCNHLELVEAFSVPIVTSIQTNNAFDESVAFLLTCFMFMAQAGNQPELPQNVTDSSSVILTPLAGIHPDPAMRHLLLRLLSVLLSLSNPSCRLQVMEDMLISANGHTPQVRIAAVGLVKEFVLEALNGKSGIVTGGDPLGTPEFLNRLELVLFRTDPPGLFCNPDFDAEDFIQSSEPRRLTECLSLYYVIIKRDRANRTGIRDKQRIEFVEENLLHPLRQFMNGEALAFYLNRGDDVMMAFAALQTSLERVDEALAQL